MIEIDLSAGKYSKGEKILKDLIEVVKQCQQRFAGKREIATESNDLVTELCSIWENVLCYGVKSSNYSSLLRNVQEIVYRSSDCHLWDFVQTHLTKHEQVRFNGLENVSSKPGKLRALIRASLNERSLERYLYMWLGDPAIRQFYEPWALMLSPEAANLLPSIAAGLASILFAISIDSATLDIVKHFKREPVIFAPAPVGPRKRTVAVKRHILSSDESESVNSGSLSSDSKETDKDVILYGEEEGCMHLPPPPLISDILNSDFTFPENFIENMHESEIPASSPKVESGSSDTSSIQSSTSLSSGIGMRNSDEKLKEALDRCAFLEARVAELSLENRRLHRLLGIDANSTENYSVAIPSVILVNSGRRRFHIYHIKINFKQTGDDWTVPKRYSEFYKLHQSLKAKNEFVRALDFPPKKFGRMNATFIEERRQRLQIYLRHLLALLPETASCITKENLQNAFPFFKE